ncbi:alpha/beta hydrolase [Mucilaginibacter sp.]|uniref:alpha/beta fold hydrolase n=1 Tax=Mucilaginibacter sp. TaxID=1882438 RepID=UPI002ED53A2C
MIFGKTNGSGNKKIIFIHGNSQSHQTWDDVITYEGLKDYISITIDLPGHGLSVRSIRPAESYSLKGLGKALREFLDLHKNDDYILIGASLGCNVIAEACPLPSNCRGAFLLGPQIIGAQLTLADIIKPNPNIGAVFTNTPANGELHAYLGDMVVKLSPELKERCKNTFLQTDITFREFFSESVSRQDWSDEIELLRKSKIPIAVVYGQLEKFVFSEYLNKTDLKKWRDEIIVVPEAGHFAHLDQPDWVADLIKEFAVSCLDG